MVRLRNPEPSPSGSVPLSLARFVVGEWLTDEDRELGFPECAVVAHRRFDDAREAWAAEHGYSPRSAESWQAFLRLCRESR